MTMTRPHATRTLALNGLTITATISRDGDSILKSVKDDDKKRKEEYEMKCKQRQEYYDMKNKDKSIENSKDSLDLIYEKKRGIGKSSSADFQASVAKEKEILPKEKCATIHHKRRRDSSLERIEKAPDTTGHLDGIPVEFFERPNGIPRSISDIPEFQKCKIRKWSEMDFFRIGNHVSRKDKCPTTLIPVKHKKFSDENVSSKRNFESAEFHTVTVEINEEPGKTCKNSDKDKIFRNNRSRSATIPRKWSEHSLSTPSTTSDEVDDLPDGSCFRRTIHRPNLRRNLNRKTAAIRTATYVGSFPVAGADQSARAEYVRSKLLQLRGNVATKPVLLVISLSGIKVCSTDGKSVHMAHALRRISYATCDPEGTQFSFLAREPRGHFSLQYCHTFVTQTPEQAEELNSIVGNAFRMAYAAQLQRQPTFQEVIASQLQDSPGSGLWAKNLSPVEMNVTLSDSPTLRLLGGKDPPRSIPGLRSVHNMDPDSNQSTPSSDESNSPTELNSYKRLADKPPLIKRLAMGLTNNERTEDSRPLVTPSPASPVRRPLSGGYVNEAVTETENNKTQTLPQTKQIEIDSSRLSQSSTEQEIKSKRISQISSSSSGSCPTGPTPPPPPPERIDSLTGRAEEGELRAAPWFQAGIPREITLEVLGQEPVGAFMVRESTSKPGCYALSLRVPRDFQPSGIAHYLIMRTAKGYKIKGFTKEFTTLTALITHHSVMPELLPCPLSLSRFNASFTQSDSGRDFADIDSDPDYDTLADFRRMMADLNV